MSAKRTMSVLVLLLITLSVFLSSCASDQAQEIAVIVALTQTAAALQQQPVPETQLPAAQGYAPLSEQECSALNDALSVRIGFSGQVTSPVPFEDFVKGEAGSGCQIFFSATGVNYPNSTGLADPATAVLQETGWVEDMAYGAGGAGGYATAFRKDATLCTMIVAAEPADRSLCPADQPIASCWENLAPEQKLFSVTLNCSTYSP